MSRLQPTARVVALAFVAYAMVYVAARPQASIGSAATAAIAARAATSATTAPAVAAAPPAPTAPATPAAPKGPTLVLPRAAFTWKADGFGQVTGETIACPPLSGRIKSIAPGAKLPPPLDSKGGTASLRISGTTESGISRDIAALQWTGPVITWQRMPVPGAAFEKSLKALASWMMTNSFAVTLEDGSVIQVGTEPQKLSIELGTTDRAAATVGVADVPRGTRLAVPNATPMPADGTMGAGPFLIEIGRSEMGVRLATYPDTMIDIEVTDVPAQVRASVMTPSGVRLARVTEEIAVTDELLKGAPPDQQAILGAERAALQAELGELRKAAASERIRPTEEPILASLVDAATGREYATIAITVKDGDPSGVDARRQQRRTPSGAAGAPARGVP